VTRSRSRSVDQRSAEADS